MIRREIEVAAEKGEGYGRCCIANNGCYTRGSNTLVGARVSEMIDFACKPSSSPIRFLPPSSFKSLPLPMIPHPLSTSFASGIYE